MVLVGTEALGTDFRPLCAAAIRPLDGPASVDVGVAPTNPNLPRPED